MIRCCALAMFALTSSCYWSKPSQPTDTTHDSGPDAAPPATGIVLHGDISTLGPRPAPTTIRLRDDGLERAARICNGSICVTGGITP